MGSSCTENRILMLKWDQYGLKVFLASSSTWFFFNRDENCETKKLELFLGGLELLDIALVIGQLLA